MDVRLSPEQLMLRNAARQVVDRLGPKAVAQLDDAERAAKLDAALAATGWRELRTPADGGDPWASAVEVAVVAEELGRGLADVAYLGPTMAADLRRLAGAPAATVPETVALSADLAEPAAAAELGRGAVAIDAKDATSALVLLAEGDGYALGSIAVGAAAPGVDLTRVVAGVSLGATVSPLGDGAGRLGRDDIDRWRSLGLATTCADLVGVMQGALTLSCDYARSRQQYGAAIGSFQAVQHLLADALVALEGSRSIARHAAWAVDALDAPGALEAASGAKAYCARAARAVCETAIQVHGGIGNTWDCLAHVFLRRALLSSEVLGGVGANLARVLVARDIGVTDGLR